MSKASDLANKLAVNLKNIQELEAKLAASKSSLLEKKTSIVQEMSKCGFAMEIDKKSITIAHPSSKILKQLLKSASIIAEVRSRAAYVEQHAGMGMTMAVDTGHEEAFAIIPLTEKNLSRILEAAPLAQQTLSSAGKNLTSLKSATRSESETKRRSSLSDNKSPSH